MDQLHEELKEPAVATKTSFCPATRAATGAETELLIPEEAGRAISEKERMKDRKFSWGQQRTNSEQVDEDADVDTAMAALDDQPEEAQPPSPRRKEQCYRSVISDIFDGSILSLEDLAKLHSAIYQNVPAKPGACGDSYATQGWLAFIVEYIRRCAHLATSG
ncbi:hypothetical protein P7K49_001833 [Saguinus oedipus]|uniref:Uncharacterized protein n=1 Tax=Saguinus oedipus TaxID=9490 RepID=A0ABQ9WFM0_SAGOE|nr:hypothetical protein P7K49_001833 [Saguinus oedipus]